MIGNYGAGYLPTGAASSPGLYNMALYNQKWLPSWASLKGGIMGPLYSPQISDPATVQAIMDGAWNFTTAGSMFDPQGNYDLVPGAIPNHYYNGRSMTVHGWGSPYGGPLEEPSGLALAGALVGGFLAFQLFWAKHVSLGTALSGRAARNDILLGASAGALLGFLARSRPASWTPGGWSAWVNEMSTSEKIVYIGSLAGLGYTAFTAMGISRRAKVRKNRGHRKNRKHSRRRRSKR